jgi:hypothetical protein
MFAVALLALAGLLAPSGALAAANHPFLAAINGGYEDACGVGLFGGGMYVSDYYHDAVVLPSGKLSPAGGPCKLDFDSGGDLYVNEWHRAVVKYSSSELLPGTGTVIDEDQPTGDAVARSSGNVFVAHRTYVAEYNAAGAPLATIGAGHLTAAYGVAVSEFPATAGYLYVPDAATHTVKIFNPASSLTEPIGKIDGSATPQSGFRYLVDAEVVVDNNPTSPSYGHVYVLDAIGHGLSEHPEAVLDEFNAAGAYRGQITGFSDAEPSGVAIEAATGNVFVSSGNSEGSAVFKYGPTSAARGLQVTKTGSGGGTVTSSPAGIACGSSCAAEYNEGQTVTFFAAPDAHSAFAGWTVTGSGAEPCPGLGSCTVLFSANRQVSANFEEPTQETLTVGETGTGAGTVLSEPAGISCPGACSEHFNQGRLVTLTASPAPHSAFAGWGGPDCDESTVLTCKVTMSAAKAMSAKFDPIPQLTLSVTRTGSGQGTVSSSPSGISCPGACSAGFDQGSTVYLLAAPSPGSGFAGFSGGGCAGSATICAVSISSAQSVVAEFSGTASGPSASPNSSALKAIGLSSIQTRGRLASVALTVSQPGTLIVSGPNLRSKSRVVGVGAATLRVRLNSRGTRLLRRHHRLRTRLTLGFVTPGATAGVTTSAVLHFRRRDRGNFDMKGR